MPLGIPKSVSFLTGEIFNIINNIKYLDEKLPDKAAETEELKARRLIKIDPKKGKNYKGHVHSIDNNLKDIRIDPQELEVLYSGYGSAEFIDGRLMMSPKEAVQKNETHAALALIKQTQEQPVQDFRLKVTAKTIRQLRQNDPANTWECLWLFFNYVPDGDKKKTNYFVLKKDAGTELGLAFDEVGQTFLETKEDPKLEFNKDSEYIIEKRSGRLRAWIDKKLVMDFKPGKDKALYDKPGSIGFYTEDAQIEISSVKLQRLK